jgi:UDP-2,4-diacetamido-2,4,6-trideoxy-beta-L-altropyranose hydrolase
MKFAVRVDSGYHIGSGHLMRCLALCEAVNSLVQEREKNDACEFHFICRAHPGAMLNVEQENVKVHCLPPGNESISNGDAYTHWLGVDSLVDVRETNEVLDEIGKVDWLVVDHYGIEAQWESACRSRVKNLMVIDDLVNRRHDCDFLLDQTYGRTKAEYSPWIAQNSDIKTGIDFALLREEFSRRREYANNKMALLKKENRGLVEQNPINVLVSMGGVDPFNITGLLLECLDQCQFKQTLHFNVVLSNSAPHIQALKETIEGLALSVDLNLSPTSMADMMLASDFCIGTVGAITWERCCLALPTLAVLGAENQKDILSSLVEAGAITYLGLYSKLSPAQLESEINQLVADKNRYQAMVQSSFEICDGLGAPRIAEYLLERNHG